MLIVALASICGCSMVDGVGQAVQGLGRDICWLSKQRVSITDSDSEIYVSEVGGEKAYFQKVDGQYVRVAMR